MPSIKNAAERTKIRPRRRNSHALARAARRCSKPLAHRWTSPCHVPAFRAGLL